MITPDMIKELRIGIEPITDRTCLLVESALEWIDKNTTIKIDLENLPAKARLFVAKYVEIMSIRAGVASESIGGLSQSFVTDKSSLLWEAAEELLSDVLKSRCSFVTAQKRWR